MKWILNLTTFKDDRLKVTITDKAEDEAEDIILKGSADALATSEECDDVMDVSRTSTGYIRIINNGEAEGIMPTNNLSHYVSITDQNEDLLWQGYLQAQQFGREMFGYKETVDFALNDILQSLDYVMMDDTKQMQTETLGQLINEAMSAIDAEWTGVVYPKEWNRTTDHYSDWMNIQVSRYNWFKENTDQNEEDEDNSRYDRMSYKALLEEIARMMGWTVCVDGRYLMFISHGAEDYELMYIDGTIGEWDIHGGNLEEMTFTQLSNIITTDNGAKQVKIEAQANVVDDLDVGVETSNLEFVRLLTREERPSGSYTPTAIMRSLIYRNEFKKIVLGNYGMWQMGEDSPDVEIVSSAYNPNIDELPSTYDGYLVTHIARADIYDPQDVIDKKKISYSYSDCIVIESKIPKYHRTPSDITFCNWEPQPVCILGGVILPNQNNGCFDLTLELETIRAPWTAKVILELQVGELWWNGIRWDEEPATFEANVIDGQIEVTKTIDMLYEDASHYVIPISRSISGNVTLKIYANDEMINQSGGVTIIKNLGIKYCNPETFTADKKEGSATYSAQSQNGFDAKKETSLMMATKTPAMKSGFGILYYNGELLKDNTIRYKGEWQIPEKALLQKMRTNYFHRQDIAEPTVESLSADVPMIGDIIDYDGSRWAVCSREINWLDNEVKLKIARL